MFAFRSVGVERKKNACGHESLSPAVSPDLQRFWMPHVPIELHMGLWALSTSEESSLLVYLVWAFVCSLHLGVWYIIAGATVAHYSPYKMPSSGELSLNPAPPLLYNLLTPVNAVVVTPQAGKPITKSYIHHNETGKEHRSFTGIITACFWWIVVMACIWFSLRQKVFILNEWGFMIKPAIFKSEFLPPLNTATSLHLIFSLPWVQFR